MPRLSTVPGHSRDQSVLGTLRWSIGVVLIGGLLAALTTSCQAGSTELQQAGGPILPNQPVGNSPERQSSRPATAALSAQPTTTSATAKPPAAPTTATTKPAKATTVTRATTPTTAALKAAPITSPTTAAPRFQPDAGTYALRIAGTSSVDGKAATVPTSGSLVVEARGQDQQHRTVGVPGGLVVVQRASVSGTDLVSLGISAASKTLSFVPSAPMAYIRTNAGQSWAGSARSTDGSVGLTETGQVTGTGSVTIDGRAIPVVLIRQEFTVSGMLAGTVVLTSSISSIDRLPLVQRQVIDAKATLLGLFSTRIVSDTTTTMTATSPR